mmetsp:Transcript_31731/g.83918  ORF Transcript_31731/g.83918 Transcript_31731/m.83918 type:complete len:275 (-) Transcript_31731:134-958(-)
MCGTHSPAPPARGYIQPSLVFALARSRAPRLHVLVRHAPTLTPSEGLLRAPLQRGRRPLRHRATLRLGRLRRGRRLQRRRVEEQLREGLVARGVHRRRGWCQPRRVVALALGVAAVGTRLRRRLRVGRARAVIGRAAGGGIIGVAAIGARAARVHGPPLAAGVAALLLHEREAREDGDRVDLVYPLLDLRLQLLRGLEAAALELGGLGNLEPPRRLDRRVARDSRLVEHRKLARRLGDGLPLGPAEAVGLVLVLPRVVSVEARVELGVLGLGRE